MNAKHTLGPLTWSPTANNANAIRDQQNRLIFMTPTSRHSEDQRPGSPYTEIANRENARRCVVLWAACEGISTEQLERGAMAQYRVLFAELADAKSEIQRLQNILTTQNAKGRVNGPSFTTSPGKGHN